LGINCLLLIIAYFVSVWLKAAPPTIKLLSQYVSYVLFAAAMFSGGGSTGAGCFFAP